MADRVDPRIVPPSIRDARSRAFGEVMRKALAEPDFRGLLMEWIDSVDARLLPFLIREFNIQHFVEPGMSEAIIRRLLKGSFELHAQIGFIFGVRTGLAMLGIAVTSWSQWFQHAGAPGTHIARVSIGEEVFVGEGRAITTRLQRAIHRMVSRMQRYSQHVTIRFGTAAEAPVFVGAVARSRIRIRALDAPLSRLVATPPVHVGAAVRSSWRITPRTP